MERHLLKHIPVVLAVARRRGFAAAARELGMSPSNVSHAVRAVEEALGVPLFARTTRSVALTEAGHRFVALAGSAITDLGSAWDEARSAKMGASGLLRINAPRIAMPWVLVPVVQRMKERYPDVTVEFFLDDGLSDIVSEGFDAGVRLGHMVAHDMVVVRLTPPFRVILVASPGYLADRGSPDTLAQLTEHNCIQYRMTSAGTLYRWRLQRDGADLVLETQGTVIVNDMLQALELAKVGVGVCYTFEPLAREALRQGALVEILPEVSVQEGGFLLYYPQHASEAPKLRAFIDTIKAKAAV